MGPPDSAWSALFPAVDLAARGAWRRVVSEADGHTHDLLIVNDGTSIRALYNVCQHRGHPIVIDGDRGHADTLRCPLHGWCYALSGALTVVPGRAGFVEEELQDLVLRGVACRVHDGMVEIALTYPPA